MSEGSWDEGLDERQRAAVLHGNDPLVIVAGAGTGKTRTLVSRVACLVDRGVDPGRILLLTFTRRAAADMVSRASVLCPDRAAGSRLWGGTFHAMAHRLVVAHAESLGLPPAPSVLDAGDARDLLDLLRHDVDLTGTAVRMPRPDALADVYSRAVNSGRPARELIAAEFPWCAPHTEQVLELCRSYVARKRERGLLDFDDLLLAWRSLLANPVVGPTVRGRWDHVLVDEYQDVNQIQVDIVRLLRPDGQGLTIVGDDAQAIYGFRGASSHHLTDTVDAYPTATVIRLETNFRSGQPILDVANGVRPTGNAAFGLTLASVRPGGRRPQLVRCHDANAEARLVVDAVLAAVQEGERLCDQAVLMRTSHHSDLLELELSARRVPYVKYGGLKFLEAAHIKDFIATLRLLVNEADQIAWYRLLRLHRDIGPANARKLTDTLSPDPARNSLRISHNEAVALAPAKARAALASTFSQLAVARDEESVRGRVAAAVELLKPLLHERYVDGAARLTDLDRLAGSAGAAESVAAFAADLTLEPPVSTSDYAGPPTLDEDYLVLSTVHSAKGLEWERVHVLHAVDGSFPSDMALSSDDGVQEEARLMYVAVTRAREHLSVYTPLRLPHHRFARDDKHSYALASRFLTDDVLRHFDVVEAVATGPTLPAPLNAPVAFPTLDELWV